VTGSGDDRPADTPETGEPAAASPDARPVVLVVEDEDSLRGMLALVLDSAGFEAVLCPEGTTAVATLDGRDRLDAALLDLRMPGIPGTEVLARIRRHSLHHAMPVIAMSAYSDESQARELRAQGATEFLPKPFAVAEVIAALQRVMGHTPAGD